MNPLNLYLLSFHDLSIPHSYDFSVTKSHLYPAQLSGVNNSNLSSGQLHKSVRIDIRIDPAHDFPRCSCDFCDILMGEPQLISPSIALCSSNAPAILDATFENTNWLNSHMISENFSEIISIV